MAVKKEEKLIVRLDKHPKSQDLAVRERLLKAAIELFSRKGYSATTTREIVAAAGVTKPVLYYYFRNKEGIYLELMRGTYEKFNALLNTSRCEQGSATERVLRLSDQVFSLFIENLEVARLMYSIYYGPHQGAPFFDFDVYHLKLQDTVRQLVEEGIRRHELKKENPEDMMWTIIGAIHIATEMELCHPEWGLGWKGLHRVLTLIFRGISASQGTKRRKRK